MSTHGSPETDLGSGTYDDRNRAMRVSYLELESLAVEAEKAGDDATARRARRRMNSIANRFMELNRNLVGPEARKWRTSNARSHFDDFDGAGMMGLWEAFLAWDPARTAVNPRTGDKTLVTFGTFSRNYIAGRIRREVNTTQHHGMRYHDFTARPKIKHIAEALSNEHDATPDYDQIAEAATERLGRTVTVEQVECVLRPAASSLDKPVGSDDGSATMGELIADELGTDPLEAMLSDDSFEMGERMDSLLSELPAMELFVILRRMGLDGAETQTTNQISAMTGIGREVLRRRFNRTVEELTDEMLEQVGDEVGRLTAV